LEVTTVPPLVNPLEPIRNVDRLVHGADARRCRHTGWPIEVGSGAWPVELQEIANEQHHLTGTKITRAQAEAILRKEQGL
jgi:hypothetical protein